MSNQISLYKSPIKTLRLAILFCYDVVHKLTLDVIYKWYRYIVFLCSFAFFIHILSIRNEFLSKLIHSCIYLNLLNGFWWIGLGFLSSVGLGSGIHTGLLFLFPHIYSIVTTIEKYNTLDFDPRINMWNNLLNPGEMFTVPSPNNYLSSRVNLFMILLKVLPYSFLWGFGTALGELPPYAAAYAASKSRLNKKLKEINRKKPATGSSDGGETCSLERLSAKKASELLHKTPGFDGAQSERRSLDDFLEPSENESQESDRGGHSFISVVKNNAAALTKRTIVYLINKLGGYGVFLLSCWPNLMFDLCGIICGHYLMDFWTFFIPLVIGKGVIKVFFQTVLLIFLFSNRFEEKHVDIILWFATKWPVSKFIKGGNDDLRNTIHRELHIIKETLSNVRENSSSAGGERAPTFSVAADSRGGNSGFLGKAWTAVLNRLSFTHIFSWITIVVVVVFSVSIINEAARHQEEINNSRLEKEKAE